MIDTDQWPLVRAKWYTPFDPGARRRVRVIVIHDMEAPESCETAENVAKYFQDPRDDHGKAVKASAHICVDCNSIVQCVRDNDIAYAAPGCNNDGIQIELAGYMKQTREQWLDPYGVALLAVGADATAQYCLKYAIPPVHLTNDQLRAGQSGIVGHVQVSVVYQKSTHADPGPNFPWEYFINHVLSAYQSRRPSAVFT